MNDPKDEPRFGIPGARFPIGVEYYRAPTPKRDVWDEDFARIRAAGFRIIRSFSYWNWMEPTPGQYELDDFDELFDLAAKHDLFVWLDITLNTHGACPEWLIREHPDLRVVNYLGQTATPQAGTAYPQGAAIHCYDHPAWREYGGRLLRHIVNRYKERSNLLIWGLWDAIGLSSAWSRMGGGYPCYCQSTLSRYKAWLHERYTLDALNARLLRRWRTWEDVEPPRSNQNVIEMLLYRRFHYENLASHLSWMVNEVRQIDPRHEVRAHGWWSPRPWDERCAPEVDSWGMSMPSNNLLSSRNPCQIADRAFSFDWARSVGRNGRWWIEEIYAGMSPGGVTWKKQSDPCETTALLWMSLMGGAAGAMYWQYRPEYLSFESPGYNLVAPDGEPTARFEATARAIAHIDRLQDHLPLAFPKAEIAIVYHPESQELFNYNDEGERFLADLRGVYRTLWRHGIPADVVTPRMDWSSYTLLFLPNVTLMDEATQQRILRTLEENPKARLVAEGSFGMYSADGQTSYAPPHGFADRFGVRVADFSAVTEFDIQQGRNVIETDDGPVHLTSPCGYAILDPKGGTQPIASLNGETVGVRTADGRFTWFGFTLSAGLGDVGHSGMTLGLAHAAGVCAPVAVEGDDVVPVVRRSRKGGWLVFVLNLGRKTAQTIVRPRYQIAKAHDLLSGFELTVAENAFEITVPSWEIAVVHLVFLPHGKAGMPALRQSGIAGLWAKTLTERA